MKRHRDKPYDRELPDIRSLVVYDDPDLVVFNKPPGMLTASGPHDNRPTLWRTVQAIGTQQRLHVGIIHRLDKEASGLLVFSKNDDAYNSLKAQFFRHTVERSYMAIVKGIPNPPRGTISNRLVEWKDGTVHTTRNRNHGEAAISHYEVYQALKGCSLVRVKLETGRKHQIRVHLAELGHPIIGDSFYNKSAKAEGLMLVAIRLCLDHPRTGKRMEFEAPLPQHMRAFLRNLEPPAARASSVRP